MVSETAAQDEVHALFLKVMTGLRQEFARRFKDQRQKFPKQRAYCDTCAFRTSTDGWDGFETTAIRFIAAMELGQTFYCHEGMRHGQHDYEPPMHIVKGRRVVDVSRLTPCGAWFVFASTPPLDIREHVPEPLRQLCVEIVKRKQAKRRKKA